MSKTQSQTGWRSIVWLTAVIVVYAVVGLVISAAVSAVMKSIADPTVVWNMVFHPLEVSIEQWDKLVGGARVVSAFMMAGAVLANFARMITPRETYARRRNAFVGTLLVPMAFLVGWAGVFGAIALINDYLAPLTGLLKVAVWFALVMFTWGLVGIRYMRRLKPEAARGDTQSSEEPDQGAPLRRTDD